MRMLIYDWKTSASIPGCPFNRISEHERGNFRSLWFFQWKSSITLDSSGWICSIKIVSFFPPFYREGGLKEALEL